MTNVSVNNVNVKLSDVLQIDRRDDCFCHRAINNAFSKDDFYITKN